MAHDVENLGSLGGEKVPQTSRFMAGKAPKRARGGSGCATESDIQPSGCGANHPSHPHPHRHPSPFPPPPPLPPLVCSPLRGPATLVILGEPSMGSAPLPPCCIRAREPRFACASLSHVCATVCSAPERLSLVTPGRAARKSQSAFAFLPRGLSLSAESHLQRSSELYS